MKVANYKKVYGDVPIQHTSKYSLSPVQHIVQQHGRGEILARKVKAYSFFYLLDAKAAPSMCCLISLARRGGGRQFPSRSNPQLWRYLLESEHFTEHINPPIREPIQQANWAPFHHALYLPKSPRGTERTNMLSKCAQFVANSRTTPPGHMHSL